MTLRLAEMGFEVINCVTCGIPFAMSQDFINARRADHRTFYCPNEHHLCYPQESDRDKVVKLTKEIEQFKSKIPKRGSNGKFIKKL